MVLQPWCGIPCDGIQNHRDELWAALRSLVCYICHIRLCQPVMHVLLGLDSCFQAQWIRVFKRNEFVFWSAMSSCFEAQWVRVLKRNEFVFSSAMNSCFEAKLIRVLKRNEFVFSSAMNSCNSCLKRNEFVFSSAMNSCNSCFQAEFWMVEMRCCNAACCHAKSCGLA